MNDTTSTAVAKPFTLMDIHEQIKTRIRAAFVELIPEEAWNDLVKAEMDKFFKPRLNYGREEPAEFAGLVKQCLAEEATKKIRAALDDGELMVQWEGGRIKLPKLIVEELVKRAPEMFAAALEGLVGNVIQGMRSR